jgi:hypothetical protein
VIRERADTQIKHKWPHTTLHFHLAPDLTQRNHTAMKSTGDERNRMDDPVLNDVDSSDLEEKSAGDKRKQRDELSDNEKSSM